MNFTAAGILMSLTLSGSARAALSCGERFNALQESRVSRFTEAANSQSRDECFEIAEHFLKDAGGAPQHCAGAHENIHDWAASYQFDTGEALPKEPSQAYAAIKDLGYTTLKTKCEKKRF